MTTRKGKQMGEGCWGGGVAFIKSERGGAKKNGGSFTISTYLRTVIKKEKKMEERNNM